MLEMTYAVELGAKQIYMESSPSLVLGRQN